MSEHTKYCIHSAYIGNPNPAHNRKEDAAPYWNDLRIKLSDRHQWSVYRRARKLADQLKLKRVLDVGCGCATKLAKLFGTNFDTVGVDVEEAIQVCKRLDRPGYYQTIDLSKENANESPLFSEPFDLIICADVIEHLEDPDILMRFIHRNSKPDSRIVLSTPERIAFAGSDSLRPINKEHIREWSLEELREYCTKSSFEVLEQYHVHPFRFAFDKMTYKYWMNQIKTRRPLKSAQLLICKLA